MMMVEAEEGSPAVEYGRAEKEECCDDSDIIDLDSFWRILGEPAYPPQDNRLDELTFVDDLTDFRRPVLGG